MSTPLALGRPISAVHFSITWWGKPKLCIKYSWIAIINKCSLNELSGVEKLTDCTDYKFRYYKNFKSVPATQENLAKQVITDPDRYGVDLKVAENFNIDNFFKKSYLDSIRIDENILTLQKVYSDPIQFKVIDFDTYTNVHSNLTESYNFNDFGEVIFMVKYLGDYDITKYGNKLIIENNGYCLVAERL